MFSYYQELVHVSYVPPRRHEELHVRPEFLRTSTLTLSVDVLVLVPTHVSQLAQSLV